MRGQTRNKVDVKNNIVTDAKVDVNAKGDVYFDAINDDIYKTTDVDKLILKIKESAVNKELTRKTAYIKKKTWNRICGVCITTKNTKTDVINQILEYGLDNLIIK
jgi:hydroxymethylglutaryl-CoA reductase